MAIGTVLLVDDEPDIRRIGQMSLELVGKLRVVLAASGQEALAVAAAVAPDVILLDVMMPELDGPATLARLRQDPATARFPVIFMTAKGQRAELERYLSLGVAGVIRKPFDPLSLPAEIHRLVAGVSPPGPRE